MPCFSTTRTIATPGTFTPTRCRTRDDGTYELVGLPGRGLVAICADQDRYLKAQGADRIPGVNQKPFTDTMPRSFDIDLHHAFAEVKPAEDAGEVTCDVALDPGRTLRGTVLGPDGGPLIGAIVAGLSDVEPDGRPASGG